MSHKPRVARLQLQVLAISFGVLTGSLCAAQEKEPLPLDDPNAAIATVLAALKEIKYPTSGRGTGAMLIKDFETENEERNFTLKFAFKGPNSVADIIAQDESGVPTRWYCEVNSPKTIIRVRPWEARIEPPEVHQPMIGFDFRPEIFFNALQYPVTEHLELALKHPEVPRSLELDDKSILHFASGNRSVMTKVSFDTSKGCRPVYYESRWKRGDGSWSVDTTALEWAQYDGHWYVARAEIKTLPEAKAHRVFTLTEFKPDVKVDGKAFTLDGLGLPEGFPVSDAVEHITYRYGDKANAVAIIHRPKP